MNRDASNKLIPLNDANLEENVDNVDKLIAGHEVIFADPVNSTFPLDTPEHIREAWAFFSQGKPEYYSDQVKAIRERIRAQADKRGIKLDQP